MAIIPTKEKPPLPSVPTGWPSDKLTTRLDRDDVIILMHPQRASMKFDLVKKKWSAL